MSAFGVSLSIYSQVDIKENGTKRRPFLCLGEGRKSAIPLKHLPLNESYLGVSFSLAFARLVDFVVLFRCCSLNTSQCLVPPSSVAVDGCTCCSVQIGSREELSSSEIKSVGGSPVLGLVLIERAGPTAINNSRWRVCCESVKRIEKGSIKQLHSPGTPTYNVSLSIL